MFPRKDRIRPGSGSMSPDSDSQGIIKFRQLADHGRFTSPFNHKYAAFTRFFPTRVMPGRNKLLLSKRILATGTGIAAAKLPIRQIQ